MKKVVVERTEGDRGMEDMKEFDNIIILNDESGNDVQFEFLDLVEYAGDEYVILLPVEESDENGKVVILKVEESVNDDEDAYVGIEDHDVLDAVFAIFKEKFKEQFDFVDEESV